MGFGSYDEEDQRKNEPDTDGQNGEDVTDDVKGAGEGTHTARGEFELNAGADTDDFFDDDGNLDDPNNVSSSNDGSAAETSRSRSDASARDPADNEPTADCDNEDAVDRADTTDEEEVEATDGVASQSGRDVEVRSVVERMGTDSGERNMGADGASTVGRSGSTEPGSGEGETGSPKSESEGTESARGTDPETDDAVEEGGEDNTSAVITDEGSPGAPDRPESFGALSSAEGIGTGSLDRLRDAGVDSLEQIANLGPHGLSSIDGIGGVTAARLTDSVLNPDSEFLSAALGEDLIGLRRLGRAYDEGVRTPADAVERDIQDLTELEEFGVESANTLIEVALDVSDHETTDDPLVQDGSSRSPEDSELRSLDSLSDDEVPTRALNKLEEAGINSSEQIENRGPHRLADIDGVGPGSAARIVDGTIEAEGSFFSDALDSKGVGLERIGAAYDDGVRTPADAIKRGQTGIASIDDVGAATAEALVEAAQPEDETQGPAGPANDRSGSAEIV